MSMKHDVLFRRTVIGTSIAPVDINNSTVNGLRISEPWKQGNELRFIFAGGVWAATTNLIAKLQLQQRSDDAWVDYENANAADVEFLQTKLDDAGAGEASVISGTIDLTYVDSVTYQAVRIQVQNTAAVSALVCVVHEIHGLFSMVAGDVSTLDDMWELQKAL